MLASLDGDAAAHRTLLDRLSQYLRAISKRRFAAGRREVDRDARRDTCDPAQPLTAWVFAIARYRLIDHFRHTRSSMADVPLEDAGELLRTTTMSRMESAYDLDRLLGCLPDKMRRAIQCVKLDGMRTAEAASRCGVSESAIKVNVHWG